MLDTIEVLGTLSDAIGVSGHEDDVRETLRDMVTPFVDEVRVDALGNLLATRHGEAGAPRLLLDAHMDEVGFLVQYVEDDGFLRISPVGGWDERILASHALTIVADDGSRVKGVIGTLPPHVLEPADRDKPHRLADMFVDIGAADADEVRARGIRIGSPAAPAYPFERYGERFVCGKALDDRAGCAVLVKTLEALAEAGHQATVTAGFAVCEEIGLVGATTSAYQVEPDIALALEGTVCTDVPGVPPARQPTRAGLGPSITVADHFQVVRPRMVRALTAMADSEGIPWQYKLPGIGGTNAGVIQKSRGGVLTGVVSVPCRYIHSPFSLLCLDDLDNAVRLATAFARRCTDLV
jgi:putative aminopeptidase FrvX